MVSNVQEACCALVSRPLMDVPTEIELRRELEKPDDYSKYQAMKRLITSMLNGDKFPGLLMYVMRFVMPVKDNNKLKKLLLIYWEIVPKHGSDGNLLHEMILVCDAYRRDLTHPNEYVRGATLRFLCRLKEPELLEPLMPPIKSKILCNQWKLHQNEFLVSCLQHRHAYVRRNAILAIFTIYKNFPQLITDACELITQLLESESDMSCRRNAFMMLVHVDRDIAIEYLSKNESEVSSYGDVLQLIVLELIFRSSKLKQYNDIKPMFLRIISEMIVSGNTAPSVKFEAANVLLTLTSTPKAIKSAAKCLIDVAVDERDNNVKLIIIQKLFKLKELYGDRNILQDMAVDVLPIMNTTDLLVIEQTFELVNGLTNGRNLDNIIKICKGELIKSQAEIDKETSEIRTLYLVRALHAIVIKFPTRLNDVLEALIEYLPQAKQSAALEILNTVKDVFVSQQQSCIDNVVSKLIEIFPYLEIAPVIAGCCWIIAEFCTTSERLSERAFNVLLKSFKDFDDENGENKEEVEEEAKVVSLPKVTKDGTYAMQSALMIGSDNLLNAASPSSKLLNLILKEGKYSLAISLCSAITKLCIRAQQSLHESLCAATTIKAIIGLLNRILSDQDEKRISKDEYERILLCIRLLTCPSDNDIPRLFAEINIEDLKACIQKNHRSPLSTHREELKVLHVDEPLKLNLFMTGGATDNVGNDEAENSLDHAYQLALGNEKSDTVDDINLDCVHQLTGVTGSIV